MSSLRPIDFRLVEELVEFVRGRGCVLNFSDVTFSEFFAAIQGSRGAAGKPLLVQVVAALPARAKFHPNLEETGGLRPMQPPCKCAILYMNLHMLNSVYMQKHILLEKAPGA